MENNKEFQVVLDKLSCGKKIERSYEFKKRFVESLIGEKKEKKKFVFFPRIFVPVFITLLLLFLSITSVVKAQKSLPGETLYPVKRLSENIISVIRPEFKEEIQQRREEEIKDLKSEGGDPETIKEAEQDLESEAEINEINEAQEDDGLESVKTESEREEIKSENETPSSAGTEIRKTEEKKSENPERSGTRRKEE